MTDRRRLLVALVIAPPLGTELDGLRRALGSRDLERIPPHITLVPPRNVPNAAADLLTEHLDSVAAAFAPILAELGPAATFPTGRGVLYLSVNGDGASSIASLAADLETGPLAPRGATSARAFVPHVTLSTGLPAREVELALELFAELRAEARFESFTLFEQDQATAPHPWCALEDRRLGRPSVTGRGGWALTFHVSSVASPSLGVEAAGATPGTDGQHLGFRANGDEGTLARANALATGSVLLVEHLEVELSARGFGVGAQLVRFIERFAGERELETAFADVRSPGFLARLGYRSGALGLYARER